jgi:hypothetical protein
MIFYCRLTSTVVVKEFPREKSASLFFLVPNVCICVIGSSNDDLWMKIAYCENFKVLNAESDTYFVGGWILSKSINNHTNNFELIDKNELEDSWRMEKDKRKRLSSAITAMLVRSHSIPKAT